MGSERVQRGDVLKQDLGGEDIDLEETHISWVFLAERDVWKVKKPVDLGFLYFTTPSKRREACEAEVRLNRPLAPDVYRGFVPITLDSRGRHRFGGPGRAVDWAVHMVRLPLADRADTRLTEGRLKDEHLQRVAKRLAAFHAAAEHGASVARFGTVDAIERNVRENFDQTRASVDTYVGAEQAEEIERTQLAFLRDHGSWFDDRIRHNRVRDGHGDLRLEHVYLDQHERVTVIDRIEFNERFRYADVCADVAFLAMDLAWHGRVDLAERFLGFYARESGDFDLYRLINFYESYRAYVRGKVLSFLAEDTGIDTPLRARAAREARRFFLLALASERPGIVAPRLIAVGGHIAAGKSTVAEALSAQLAAPVVDTDRTRKQMLGVAPTEKVHVAPFSGAYDPTISERVYDEVLRRAEMVLASGRTVILDASFRTAASRRAAVELARSARVPFTFFECRVPDEVGRRRLRRRELEAGVSDGRLEIFDAVAARWEPVDELPAEQHVVVRTADSPLGAVSLPWVPEQSV